MAESITIARPYAEAAFALAREQNRLGPWEQALERLARVAADREVQRLLGNPRVTPEDLARLFIDVAGGLDEAQQNFVRTLVDNERLAVLPEIHRLYVELKNRHEGIREAHIVSAFPLDDAALARLVAELEPRFKCRLRATVSVDPELIGGVKISVGDQVIDASVRGKLEAMATALKA